MPAKTTGQLHPQGGKGNIGVESDDPTIATAKGWTVISA